MDWSKASIRELILGMDILIATMDGDSKKLLEAVNEELWRLQDLEG